MKPIFAKVSEDLKGEVYSFKTINLPFFSTEFHFHKECQLVYVVQSEGKRIVGDSVEFFESDELILLGPDIPHVWHNDISYFEENDSEKIKARSIALFFHPEKLTHLLSKFMSVAKLEAVLKKSQRGMKFFGKTKKSLKQLLLDMDKQDDMSRLISLLKVMELITHNKEYELLASDGYINTYQSRDNERMDKVFKYVFDNFGKTLLLDEAAALAYMNKQAFCRYFKNRTQKTFVEFVNNVRISHACKTMAAGDYSIGQLAYDCGFNSISNFNRFFKKIKGITPREYRKVIGE